MMVSARTPLYSVEVEERLVAELRRAAASVPAYRALLDEHAVRVEQIVDVATFIRLAPLLSKANTFDRFSIAEMSVGGVLRDVAEVLTSSGHGGRFSFGLITKNQAAQSPAFVDDALDAAFSVKTKPTLAINCLPMGVVLSSQCMTIGTTSVREDMAIALVRAFGDNYAQILLIGDPLFLKRLTDYARAGGVDWRRYQVGVVLGEEIFGEHFRGYLAASLHLDLDAADGGYVMSSFGVGELGLNLCYETRATVALRRACFEDRRLARDLLGVSGEEAPLPVIFTFNPLRTFIEVLDSDGDGYGALTISMLDSGQPLPLLRYQTNDVARLLDADIVAAVLTDHGISMVADLPVPLLALQGRRRERLPNRSHVGIYKDALYADHDLAQHLSGALRLVFSGETCSLHVQLVRNQAQERWMEEQVLHAIPPRAQPTRVVLWPYEQFPFGMGLDYERKFAHYQPGEPDP